MNEFFERLKKDIELFEADCKNVGIEYTWDANKRLVDAISNTSNDQEFFRLKLIRLKDFLSSAPEITEDKIQTTQAKTWLKERVKKKTENGGC